MLMIWGCINSENIEWKTCGGTGFEPAALCAENIHVLEEHQYSTAEENKIPRYEVLYIVNEIF